MAPEEKEVDKKKTTKIPLKTLGQSNTTHTPSEKENDENENGKKM